ncbi:MAG: response regulator transcription factor [Terracidiphilus sp.]|jgi:DNA-binding NarL/FixJ family response regulator
MASELYSRALRRCTGFRVAACSETVNEALEAVRANDVDIALIGSTLMDGLNSGFVALQKIREAAPGVKSVLLLEHDEDHLVTAAFRAGAKGVFFPSNEDSKSLCRCVKQVNAGQVWANSAQLHEVLKALSRSAPIQVVNAAGEQLLTPREAEVVQLVADGLTNLRIAKELGLSEHTVRNNLFRIFDKLGVSTRVELALYAINQSKPDRIPVLRAGSELLVARASRLRPATAD